ncbi:MAG: hypothetical protein PQJ60_13035 [Spirochaetales bacterium]|nr:hypothetical protein [Spirochaetales bacterium]
MRNSIKIPVRRGVLLCLAVLAFSCNTDRMILKLDPITAFTLVAKVYNGDNQACPFVLIQLTDSTGAELVSRTDVTGKTQFVDLPFGTYNATLSREGYESISFEFDYTNEAQALYGRLYSTDQLIRLAEKSMDRGEWEEAQEYLDRAGAIEEDNREVFFLKAIILWKQGDFTGADELLSSGDPQNLPMEILLFHGDLLQYDMGNWERALSLLTFVHQRKPSEDLAVRVEQLKINIEEGTEDNE